jgi:hypothetical protein
LLVVEESESFEVNVLHNFPRLVQLNARVDLPCEHVHLVRG